MNLLTPQKLSRALELLTPYFSRNSRTVCFVDESLLVFPLPKGRIPSLSVIAALNSMGFGFDKGLGMFYIKLADSPELLTHSDKNLRELTKKFEILKQRCQVTDSV